MSGIEVAGIALAGFPILANGLKYIAKSIETARRWKLYRTKLEDYVDMVEAASVYFRETLFQLLEDIVHSDDELQLLMRDPGGESWKKPEYEERLRQRLERSHTSYMKRVLKVVQALRSMCESLGVDSDGKIRWDDYSTLEREMRRIKLAVSKSKYKEVLVDIRQANQDLREVTRQNIVLEPIKRKRQGRRLIGDLRLIRRLAASLYQVLMNDKTWNCKCKMHHLASLRLEARPKTNQDFKADAAKTPAFRVLLSLAADNREANGTAHWQEIEILHSPEAQASIKEPQTERNPDRLGSSRVRFAAETGKTGTEIRDAAVLPDTNSKGIEDFCSALCAPDRQQREIGLLIDEANNRQEHRIYRANTIRGLQTSSKSLEDLLKSTRHSGDESLSRKDRLGIAVILASSVLQLDGTSWLKSGWSSNDIFFHHKDGQYSQYSQPYLSWQRCCHIDASCPMESLRVISNHMIRNEILLALGLTLVELCFGRTLTDMRRLEDINGDETATRLATATRLHSRVYDEMGIPYGDVVRRCLFQLFDVRELSLDIEEVQQKVFDDVVTPLVDDLNNFNGVLRIR